MPSTKGSLSINTGHLFLETILQKVSENEWSGEFCPLKPIERFERFLIGQRNQGSLTLSHPAQYHNLKRESTMKTAASLATITLLAISSASLAGNCPNSHNSAWSSHHYQGRVVYYRHASTHYTSNNVSQCSQKAQHSQPSAHHAAKPVQAMDIVDTAVSAGSFKTLVAAVKAAGLVDALKGKGPFTVFAPTDKAFASLPPGTVENLLKPENKKQLQSILTYHVVPAKVAAADVVKLTSAKTLQGQQVAVNVSKKGVKINQANVVKTDIECSNGIIHVIDAVILPKEDAPAAPEPAKADIVDTAVGAGSFQTLVAAVKAAGLVETLKGEGPFTVFAPTDEAFAKLPAGTIENLLKPENIKQLQAILTYHVVPGRVMAKDVVGLKSAKTVNGKEFSISVDNGQVRVDSANVVKTDIVCSNGGVHVIDAVILP